MPQQVDFVNGKVVITGDDTANDHIPMPDAPAAPAPKAKPKPKPKPKGKAAPAKPWWHPLTHAITNEAKFVGKTIRGFDQKKGPVSLNPLNILLTPTARQAKAAATYGALQTAGEGAIAIVQRMKGSKFADPRASRPGRLLNSFTRMGYAFEGAKQPEDLTQAEKGIIDDLSRSVGIEAGAFLATRKPAGALLRAPMLQGPGVVKKGLRWGTQMGIAHGLGSFMQDSTLGNPANVIEAATGQKIPGAVDPLKDDRVTAGMKSVVPNLLLGEGAGLALSVGARAIGKAGDMFPNIARQKRARRANTEHTTANERVKATGLVEDIDGRQGFTPAARAKPAPLEMTVDERTQQILDRFGGGKPAAPAAAPSAQPASTATIRSTGPAQAAPASTAGQGFAPTTVRATGPNVRRQDAWQGGAQDPTFMATGPDQKWRDSFASDGQPVTVRSTGPNQPWREGPRVDDGLGKNIPSRPMTVGGPVLNPDAPLGQMDPGVNPWFPDEPAYEDWLRRNASNALVPTTPPDGGLDVLPRQPLAPQDATRGEGLADPWGMGPDPSSPVQQALGQKPGATVKESLTTAEQAPPPEIDPAEEFFDNGDLPEIADVQKTLDQMSVPELKAAAVAADNGGSVLESIEAITASRPAARIRAEVSEDATGMPTANLADLYLNGAGDLQPWIQQFDKIPTTTLQELAHPEASPRLFELIHTATGRDWEAFTRQDITGGIQDLSDQGLTILPNRLREDATLTPTGQVVARPKEFQYKENVNAQGEQMGQSLGGVTKWNPNLEGVVDTFTDPKTGETVVVNGHNRRALAERLGVPSLITREVDATTPAAARAEGAMANIAAGAGTPFDAAKFIKATGLKDAAQLDAAGIPTDKGYGRQGLALSRLPAEIFQEAVNETHDLGRFLDLGASGLDEAGMRGAYQVLQQRPKMSAGAFREVIGKAGEQGSVIVSSPQGSLFGDDVLNPIAQWAELTADVRQGLSKEKRIFGNSIKNAGALGEAGVADVNTGLAGQRVTDASHALDLFDRLKNAPGPLADVLNRGAAEIASGSKPGVIAKQVQREIADNIEVYLNEAGLKTPGRPDAPAPAAITPEVLPPEPTRAALNDHLLNHAAADGVVRPTETGPIDVPEGLGGDWGDMQHEQALGADFYSQDTLAAHETTKAVREAQGYDLQPWEDRQRQSGVGDEWMAPAPNAITPEVVQPASKGSISETMREVMKKMKESDVRSFAILGNQLFESNWILERNGKWKGVTKEEARAAYVQEFGQRLQEAQNIQPASVSLSGEGKPRKLSETLKDLTDRMKESDERLKELGEQTFDLRRQVMDLESGPELADVGELPPSARKALVASQASNAPPFVLPGDLSKAAPRHGNKQLQFESDLDRAAYQLANDKTKGESNINFKLREALAAAGFNVDQVVAHGTLVKRAVKQGVKEADDGTAVIPVQPFGGDNPRLPLPEQARQSSKAKQQITDLKDQINNGGCGL